MLWLAIACGALAACGGGGGKGNGGDGGSPPPPTVLDADKDSVPDTLDCAPSDAMRWQQMGYLSVDADGDGYHVNSSGRVCSGAAPAAPYFAAAVPASDLDCADNDVNAWRITAAYADQDGDGVGAGSPVFACVGTSASAGYSLLGYDPIDDPNDPAAVATSDQSMAVAQIIVP